MSTKELAHSATIGGSFERFGVVGLTWISIQARQRMRATGWQYNFRMPLSANIENLPKGIAVVRLSGGLTLGTSLKIADTQIQSAIQDGISRMVIDLTDVEYVDSAGLGMLMYAYGMLNEKKGALRVCGVTARVMSLLQMTKTDTFLPIDKTLDESLAAFQE